MFVLKTKKTASKQECVWQISVNLFYYFYCTTGCFNSSFCFFTYCIYFESEFTFQFSITRIFTLSYWLIKPLIYKFSRVEFCNSIFFSILINLAKVKYFIFNTIDIFETTFWNTALDWHLSAFMSHFAFITCTALSAFITFCRCTTFTACFTTANTFFFMCCAFCRL